MSYRRPFSSYAPPGEGQATQDDPAAPFPSGEMARSNGEGGGVSISPLKDRNPVPFVIVPWLVFVLAPLAWAALGAVCWAFAALLGIGGGNG
jgi:hypothetical protein